MQDSAAVYRFADCELDAPTRELRRAGVVQHLEPQAFDLLVVLLEQRHRVVPKLELLDGVWGHHFLSDANLTTRIKEIRRAIGDDGRQQAIVRNVRGRGYRFVADVVDTGLLAGSSLVGRSDEIAVCLAALRPGALLTVVGPGGVGKTTLAREVGAAATRGGRAVFTVELAPLPPGAPVLSAVARTVDMVDDLERPVAVERPLARLDAVVVLDNCEHVADEVAQLVERVLSEPDAHVSFLATSRVRLGVPDETVIDLHALGRSEAVQLFDRRASAVAPSWNLAHAGVDRIAALVEGLDRLPLTVEMAAARLGSMSLDDLETALADRSAMLRVSHRSPARRHRDLPSLVGWSAELLEPHQQQLFTDFAVFAGAVTAPDVAAVLQPEQPGAVVFDLAALAERSLLAADTSEGPTRYRMLDTVRAVAGSMLDRDVQRSSALRRRHAATIGHELAVADDGLRRASTHERSRRRIATLVDEARAAHRWSRDVDPLLAADINAGLHLTAYFGLWNEPFEWGRALPADRSGGRPAAAVLSEAALAAQRGDLAVARDAAEAALATATGRLAVAALELLVDVAIYAGDLDRAALLAGQLLTAARETDDLHGMTIGVVDQALCLVFADTADDAREALDLLAGFDDTDVAPPDRAWLIYAEGEAFAALGDDEATQRFTRAVELGTSSGDRFAASVARASLAATHSRAGRHQDALTIFAASLRDYTRHGNLVHAVTALRNVVHTLAAVGDLEGAAIIAGTTSNEMLRPSYGIEAERLHDLVATLRRRLGAAACDQALEAGRRLDLDQALRRAEELVTAALS